MAEQLTDSEVRERGVAALEQELGPVEALRFLALMSREPFDYQAWREKYFADMRLDEILAHCRAMPGPTAAG